MEDKEWLMKNCLCPACPTWKDCGKKEKLFCLEGKSKCIKEEKGCICGGCPVHDKMKFKHMYYCTKGKEAEQDKK